MILVLGKNLKESKNFFKKERIFYKYLEKKKNKKIDFIITRILEKDLPKGDEKIDKEKNIIFLKIKELNLILKNQKKKLKQYPKKKKEINKKINEIEDEIKENFDRMHSIGNESFYDNTNQIDLREIIENEIY